MLDEIKNAFNRPNNALIQLILINVIVFVAMGILWVISEFTQLQNVFALIYKQFSIPPMFSDFITRPWTLLTYSFAHSLSDLLHIFFNMLALYWFGRLVVEYLGSNRLVHLYIYGALAGAVVYLISYNLIPFYADRAMQVSGMVGASAAVFSIAVAAATLAPNYSFYLLFFGPVKIKYIVAAYIFFSILGMVGANAGGNLAHLGGALIGYLYIRSLQHGNDLGRPINVIRDFVLSLFKQKSNIKVTYRNKGGQKSRSGSASTTQRRRNGSNVSQEEIDAILDKISERGYESLSKEEKQKLFNASR